MSQAIDGFMLDKSLDLSGTTIAKYSYVLGRFASFVNDRPLADVTSADVRRWLLSLMDDDLSRRTVHDYWAVLSSFYSWTEKELDTSHIIRGHISVPRYKQRVIEPFTQDEVKRLLKAATHNAPWTTPTGKTVRSKRATGDRDLAIMLVFLDSGLRVSEICALHIEDYEASRGRLRVNAGKGDKERFVIVGKRARKAIWRYLTKRPKAKTHCLQRQVSMP